MRVKNISNMLTCVEKEAYVWMAGLIVLSFLNPHESHLTLCPLANLGFEFCPGCGLGKSISFLFRGDIMNSVKAHPLGIFAVWVLVCRMFSLYKRSYLKSKNRNHG